MHQYVALEDTVYLGFAANLTSGAAGDGATPLFDVRLGGAAAGAIPTLSGTPTLLTHANYTDGCYEVAIAATAANGFAANSTYLVFGTLTIDSVTPASMIGSFRTAAVPANTTQLAGQTVTAAAGVTFPASVASPTNITAGTITTATNVTTLNGIAANAITAASIAADAITAAKIADGAIDALTFAAGAINAAAIAADAITAAKVADGTIDAATFAAGAINAAAIAADAITDAKVAADVTIASVTGAVGSVTGAVGSVTGAVGSVTGNVGGNVVGTVASVVGAVGSVTGLTAATVHADLDDIQARIPAALVGGRIDANVGAISGSTDSADNLEESTEAIGYGTVGVGGTTTVFVTTALTPDSAANDQFVGRVLIFKNDTTTAALRGQATTINDWVHVSAEIGTFTVVALTTAPVTGDTFAIL